MSIKTNTHIVIKIDDALKYLTEIEYQSLGIILNNISKGRAKDNKNPYNNYYICNTDEPYAEMVKSVIYGGEYEKENSNESVKGDLINRSEVVKTIWNLFNNWGNNAVRFSEDETRLINTAFQMVQRDIEKLPTAYNGGWIPCATGCEMPNEASRVWLSFTNPVTSYVKSAWYINGHFEWDNCRRVKETPMAWKHYDVPAPYHPKGEKS